MLIRRLLSPWGLLALAAALVTTSTLVSWDRVEGVPTNTGVWGVGVFYDERGWSVLRWDGLRPGLSLRVLMVVAAWSLVLLVRLRPRLGSLVAVPVALGLALAVGVGDPAPWTFRYGSTGVRIAAGTGCWLALSACVVATVAVLTAIARPRDPGGSAQ